VWNAGKSERCGGCRNGQQEIREAENEVGGDVDLLGVRLLVSDRPRHIGERPGAVAAGDEEQSSP
jgi:hypothetical protein